MKTRLFAIHIMLVLLSLVILFHILVIIRIVPFDITWGGRLKNEREMYVFETLSIVINLFFGWVLFMKAGYVNFKFHKKVINFILWFFLLLFIVNTIGNIFAKTILEKMFTILTFTFAILICIILRTKYLPESEKPKSSV